MLCTGGGLDAITAFVYSSGRPLYKSVSYRIGNGETHRSSSSANLLTLGLTSGNTAVMAVSSTDDWNALIEEFVTGARARATLYVRLFPLFSRNATVDASMPLAGLDAAMRESGCPASVQ